MRISQLARQAGVPVSAVKFYIREGLLPVGEKSAPNQSQYDEEHVRRIRLVRALMGVGGLSVASVKHIVGEIESGDLSRVYRAAQGARDLPMTVPSAAARQRIDQLAKSQGWGLDPATSPGADLAALALDNIEVISGYEVPDDFLAAYAAAAAEMAAADLVEAGRMPSLDQMVELIVVGTIVGDRLMAGLRRMAQQEFGMRQARGEG
jgi:DNA-binding transcriptional MerR regulator